MQVKQRTKRLSDYFRAYMPYTAQRGLIQRVLVTDTATDGVHYVAHNKSFDQVCWVRLSLNLTLSMSNHGPQQVLVPADHSYMGKMIHVRIKSTGKFFLVSHHVLQQMMRLKAMHIDGRGCDRYDGTASDM
jgi:threonylcarbamoyladenosine tRNA methylthiotransferase CDKAL1